MSAPSIEHVSDTAFLVAHARAVESERPDALFHDPLAARLAGAQGRALAEAFPTAAMTVWSIAIRTVIIDAFVREAVARGVEAVFNLGAGLDTRPYRLDLPPALTWVEVDYPGVITFKEERLAGEAPRCRLERVGLDLASDAARRGFLAGVRDRAGRVFVLTEGVVPYLDLDQAGALADDLRALPGVDGWIVDYVSPEGLAHRQRAGVDERMRNAPFKFRPDDWEAFFAAHGWCPREARYLAEEGARLGRPPPLPLRARLLMRLLRPFAPSDRHARPGRFSGYGYIVLAPSAAGP